MKPELLRAKERLARNLSHLSIYCDPRIYCSPEEEPGGLPLWPSREFLAEIQNDVLVLAQSQRKKTIVPLWKAFLQVDEKWKRLRLKSHVNDLIRRARKLLSVESQLAKTVTEAAVGNAEGRRRYLRIVEDARKVRELLAADRQWMIQWCMAQDLLHWTLRIRHPMAKDLHPIAEFLPAKEELRRKKRRESVRRSRSRKKIAPDLVTPF